MNFAQLKERLRPGLRVPTTARFVPASFILEIQPDFVAGAKLDQSRRQVRRMGVATLEPDSLSPHPGRANVSNAAALREAVRRVKEAVGNGDGRAGLLLSDGAVRVAVLS